MHVQIVDNAAQSMISVLSPEIERCKEAKIAVAFVSRRGLAMIEPAIQSALETGAYIEFLIGLDMHTTEPDALRQLYELARTQNNVELFCYSSPKQGGIYHPKLYLLRANESTVSIVGSSNLTEGGLKKNIEINAVISGDILDDAIADSYSSYNRLKFNGDKVMPDAEYVEMYAQATTETKAIQRRITRESPRQILRAFAEKTKSLRRPKPTSRDIVGWPKLVYDALPKGEFSNEQIYTYADVFQQRYPGNQSIRAKIRQQLQILRDMDLIEHLGAGRWRRK
jgi:HKD family nuclease